MARAGKVKKTYGFQYLSANRIFNVVFFNVFREDINKFKKKHLRLSILFNDEPYFKSLRSIFRNWYRKKLLFIKENPKIWSEATQLTERSDSIDGAKRLYSGEGAGVVALRFPPFSPHPIIQYLKRSCEQKV